MPAPGSSSRLPLLRRFPLECALLAALAAFASAWFFGGILAQAATAVLAAGLGAVVGVRWARRGVRRLIWRLRNRLIVAYVFIAVIPIVLILLLAVSSARYLGGQIAVHLVQAELDRRVAALENAARSLARAPAARRASLLDRIETFYQQRFPGLEVTITDRPGDEPDVSGLVVRGQLVFAWARARHQSALVTLLAPVSRQWLAELMPGLGQVSIIHFPDPGQSRLALRLHDAAPETEPPPLPPPVNYFDIELLWASEIPITIWERPTVTERALLGVHSRLSAVLETLFTQKTQSNLPTLLYLYGIVFLIVEVVSIYLGVSVTRSITDAVHKLYEGTERVMQGDFSHRIEVKGDDQIAELSRSFNRMTEHVEGLLKVAKEKQRLQAEIEIARQVQAQLFPRVEPSLRHLELKAFCNPARMVSGDYYDYQSLCDGKIALALADVAGKGISAALLMASLQACVRMQVRELTDASRRGALDSRVSTSSLVARINQQLHANTSSEKYATFCLAIYDDASGELIYTNAGHLPPLLVRRGQVTPLDVNGMVVGAFPFARYDESRLVLEPGDLLVGYTDGITEPENEYGEMYGEERLIETVLRVADSPSERIIETIIESVEQFTGSPELQDDMTVIVARRC